MEEYFKVTLLKLELINFSIKFIESLNTKSKKFLSNLPKPCLLESQEGA